MLAVALNLLLWIVPFLLVLSVVITLHELGHFSVARMFGVKVDRFSLGFGKTLFARRDRHGTEWRLASLPLGGYVKFAGDENAASVPDADDLADLKRRILERDGPVGLRQYFHFKPLWQRALVVLAGPAANFLTAIVIFSAFAMMFGREIITPQVARVTAGSPAAIAGLQPGDLITRVNGAKIESFEDVRFAVLLRAGEPTKFDVLRAGLPRQIVITPGRTALRDPASGSTVKVGYLGIEARNDPASRYWVKYGPVEAVGQGVSQTVEIVGLSVTYIRRIFTGRESGDQLSGPLGIAGAAKATAVSAGANSNSAGELAIRLTLSLFGLVAMISVAVGFANLLPIPVLDGGHLLFYAYEAVARRPLAAKVQEAGFRIGFAVLIGLFLFTTWNDLQRYRVFQFLGGLVS